MTQLQEFIDACKSIEAFVDVKAQEPTDVMMAQITPAYTFSVKPTLFTFTFKDSTGTPRDITIIVPYEVWSVAGHPPVSEFREVADRFAIVPQTHVFFLKPDTVDSIVLRGHSIVPIADPEPALADVLNRLRTLDQVTTAQAFLVVDTAIIAEAGNDAIVIDCGIKDLTATRFPGIGNYIDDVVQVTLPKSIYSDPEKQDRICQLVVDKINENRVIQ